MIKTDLIHIGNTYTYKELCKLFGEPEKSSDSRNAQKKEWARFFRWTNPTNRKYKIEEIFSEPQEKADGRKYNGGNNTSKYRALDDIIMDYMIEQKQVCHTIPNLLVELGIVSHRYARNRWKHQEYQNLNLSEGVLNNIFWKMDNVLRITKYSLSRLNRDGYLAVLKRCALARNGTEPILLGKNDTARVEQIENEILSDMGLRRSDLYKNENWDKFRRKVVDALYIEFNCAVSYYYMMYDITLLNDTYVKQTKETIDDLTRKLVKELCLGMIQLDYRGFYQKSETVEQVLQLVKDFFPKMTPENWKKYIDELNPESEQDVMFLFRHVLLEEDKDRENAKIETVTKQSNEMEELLKLLQSE